MYHNINLSEMFESSAEKFQTLKAASCQTAKCTWHARKRRFNDAQGMFTK